MDEVLNLQPGELWVWLYLCYLAKEQKSEVVAGTLKITLPFMRENQRLKEHYSPRQFLRHLVSLASRNFLVILSREKNWRCQIRLALSARFYLDMGVKVDGHGSPSSAENGGIDGSTWPPASKKENEGNGDDYWARPGYLDTCVREEPQLSASARLIKSLKALIAINDQGILLQEVMEASNKEELCMQLARIAPMARGKKLSKASVIYAAIRFIQSGQGKERPAAWAEEIAKRTERLIRRGDHGTQHDQKAMANHYSPGRAAASGAFHRTGA